MENTIQHVQVPSHKDMSPEEKLVYTYLKRYMNGSSYEAHPSLPTLCKQIKMNIHVLKKHLNSLEAKDFIQIIKRPGKSSVYKFNKWVKFEPFSEEFLTNDKTSLEEKQFLICSQEHMFIDPNTHNGSISYSDSELSRKTGLDRRTIKRVNDSLKEKGYMTPVAMQLRDRESGLAREAKFYHLDEFDQAVAYVLNDHEDRISFLEKQLETLAKTNELILRENKALKKELQNQLIESITL